MSQIIDGKAIASDITTAIAEDIARHYLEPNLAVILVGDDPASHLYVSLKEKACRKVGIVFHKYLIPADADTKEVLAAVNFLNNDNTIDAILVQLPLPDNFDTDAVIAALDPAKDVDGFHPANIKKLLAGKNKITPGLPLGIIKLLENTGEKLSGKKAVIIANSETFSQPLSKLLADKNISVVSVKKTDSDLKAQTLAADILITACGQAFFITSDMVKDDVIVIDVGTNKIDNDQLVGDVDYSEVFPRASHITPVPGGVGPMTVAMLLYNTVELHKLRQIDKNNKLN